MEPARSIIKKLGGPSAVARILQVHRTRVSNWMRPREAGGTDGRIPQKYFPQLIQVARERNIPLSAEEFIHPPMSPSVLFEASST